MEVVFSNSLINHQEVKTKEIVTVFWSFGYPVLISIDVYDFIRFYFVSIEKIISNTRDT